jgi:BASS family bile acid:Na+ symporter
LDPATILKLLLVVGVVLLVLAIGLRPRSGDSLLLLRRPELGVRALAAMFILQPAFVLLLVWFLDLREGVGAALLGFAVAPVLPPWAKKGYALGAGSDYVIGLEVMATGASILVVPIMIWIVNGVFGVHTARDPWAVEVLLLVTIGLPLAVGMGVGRFRPASAPRLAFLADRIGTVFLALGGVMLLVARWRDILAVTGRGTIAVSVLIIGFGLLVGHLLGGPDPRRRGALASANVSRHPGVALLLASSALPEHVPAVTGAVLLYLVASMVVPIPYERWFKRAMARAPALIVALVLASPLSVLAEEPPPSAPTRTVEAMVGEVVVLPYNRSAAYGSALVRGPKVNLTDHGKGQWKGNIKDLDGVFTVTGERISGANLNMVMERDGEEWTCQGIVDGKRVRIVMSPGGLVARYDTRFYDLKRVAPDLWATVPTGPAIRVKGDAAGKDPIYPQFIFALLAVL